MLHKLDGKLVALAGTFAAVGTSLKAGHFNPDDIKNLGAATDSVNTDTTAATGQPIKDVPIPNLDTKPADDTTTDTQ